LLRAYAEHPGHGLEITVVLLLEQNHQRLRLNTFAKQLRRALAADRAVSLLIEHIPLASTTTSRRAARKAVLFVTPCFPKALRFIPHKKAMLLALLENATVPT